MVSSFERPWHLQRRRFRSRRNLLPSTSSVPLSLLWSLTSPRFVLSLSPQTGIPRVCEANQAHLEAIPLASPMPEALPRQEGNGGTSGPSHRVHLVVIRPRSRNGSFRVAALTSRRAEPSAPTSVIPTARRLTVVKIGRADSGCSRRIRLRICEDHPCWCQPLRVRDPRVRSKGTNDRR
jgi:hypothetical protein